ncbi:MAG: iron ABC transporter permease [Anaerolineaceae bacterium]|nr:iron ABC transporter permease [Anaerolineaceae bacterium]
MSPIGSRSNPVFAQNPRAKLWICVFLLLLVFGGSLFLGRYPKPGFISIPRLVSDPIAQSLVWNIRLPRVITAMLLGMGLAGAGLVFQMIFANPLIEPGFLGVSQGAAFGAAFSIIFLNNHFAFVQSSSIFFGLLGLFLSFFFARLIKINTWTVRLILSGIMVSAFFSSGIGILKSIADPMSQLPEITFWLLGGLWSITWPRLLSVLLPVLIGLVIIYLMRWRLNVLSLKDRIAYSIGINTKMERNLLLTAGVLAIASLTSISGIVSWVGLMIPHIARRVFGADAREALPASLILGGIFVILCDDIGRTISAGEIPLGIITALFGAIFFLILMLQGKTAGDA